MWKLKRKVCSKQSEKPSAKLNKKGEFVTDKVKLKELYLGTYKERLSHRPVHEGYESMFNLKMNLFKLREIVTSRTKSRDWTEKELMKVLKSLKTNKSGDHFGLIYEIFKPCSINDDLFKSLLLLCNEVKSQLKIPKFVTFTDITSLYKNKGDRNDLENDRGIFGVGKVRSIIEKLVYNDVFEDVDSNMSDSNVGGRKNRNIRDNLFVLYAVRNEAIQKKLCVDLHFMDLSKCFDTLWTQETMNDLYELGVKDDKFSLISVLNKKCRVSIKTPIGQTDEFILENIEMQGTVMAPLKCTGQIDSLGRNGYTNQTALYKYKKTCYVPILGMIDDTLGMSKCGEDSVELNAFINSTIESKKLYFNKRKCHKLHIGARNDECPTLKVHDTIMTETKTEKYLGDMISGTGNDENMKYKRKLGYQAISDQMTILKEVAAGSHFISIGLVFRDAVLKSKLLLNSEIWHGLTVKNVETLEEVDKAYLRKILNAHSKVGLEWLFLETGKMNLKYHIMQRRLLYLWHILSCDRRELISRIFFSQKLCPSPGDWVKMIESDKSKVGLFLEDEEIQMMPKLKFQKLVKSKVEAYALNELAKLKDKHSKSEKLELKSFKCSEYLSDYRLNKHEQQLLFKLRSRTIDVKMNFQNQHDSLLCSTCHLFPETQAHLLQCPEIVRNLQWIDLNFSKLNENDVYSTLEKQIKIVKIFSRIIEERDNLLKKKDQSQNSDQKTKSGWPNAPDATVMILDKL